MRNVLVITHLLKASPRIPGLAKYLPEFGWQPVILTAPLEEKPDAKFRIVETEYRETLGFWKKAFGLNPNKDEKTQIKERFGITSQKSLIDFAITRVGEIVNYPDSDKGWKPFAIKTGSEVIAKEGIGAIISSSSPVTAHVIASELKSVHKIPWLADLRDLWSQNHNYSYSTLRKLIDEKLELKTLSTADALITVSQPWAEKLSGLHQGKATYTITNGFDPGEVNDPPADMTSKFSITYTGLIYHGKQDISKLFSAVRDLISERVIDPIDIEVRFYGARENWLDREIELYGLSGIASQYGSVSRSVALQKQRESQLLLLLDWDDPQERGTYPGKIFEYLAARRPILATGGSAEGVVAGLLEKTGTGIWALTAADVKDALKEFYMEFKAQGKLSWHGNENEVSQYSYREMAKKFAEILDNLAPGK